jgi:hypothetical protein
MKKETESIKVCTSHQDELVTPLIWTFAFSGAEYWCPYCGKNGGMFGAGEEVESTAKLRNRLKRFEKLSKDFLYANSVHVCATMSWDGGRITPDKLPQHEKDRIQKVLDDWEYKQDPSLIQR